MLHAKMGTIKDKNRMDLRELEGIKKRWDFCVLILYPATLL